MDGLHAKGVIPYASAETGNPLCMFPDCITSAHRETNSRRSDCIRFPVDP